MSSPSPWDRGAPPPEPPPGPRPSFEPPWRVVDSDGRISIVALGGETVTEVQPSQSMGHVPGKEVKLRIARGVVAAVNRAWEVGTWGTTST